MSNLPDDILPRARQIILPLVANEDEREALLTEAFYLHDPLLYGIDRGGTPKVFAVRCISKLLDYGCLPKGEHALARLLVTARIDCGVDKHGEIDTLTTLVNALCREEPPPVPTPPTPALPVTTPPISIHTPREERRPTVFISYSHKDTVFAQRLIADLNAAGHAVWVDTAKIKSGDEWVRSITEGINNSYAFITVVSTAANESTWVRREFLWAEHKQKRTFPVMAEKCEPVIYLMERQIVFMHTDYARGLTELLAGLPQPELSATETSEADEREFESLIVPEKITPTVSRRQLELDYLEQLRAEALFDLEKYTPLGGESQFVVNVRRGETVKLAYMRPEFEHLRSHDEQHTETRRFDNAVDEILRIKRAVLLGEPGAGKTTTFLSLAGKLAQTAQDDPKAALPLFVRLGRWTDSEQALFEFIAGELGALGTYLQTLFEEGRAVLLLDGMNEIPVSQRDTKYQQIRTFITRYPEWVAVASCRERDYTVDLQLDKIRVTPLDPLRIREFVTRYLGDEHGETLFWKIAGQAAKQYYERYLVEYDQTQPNVLEHFWGVEIANRDPAGKFFIFDKWGYRNRTWEDWIKIRDDPASLMQLAHNPYMLSMLTQVYAGRGDLPANRGALFREFVETLLEREKVIERDKATGQVRMTPEAEALLTGLARVAYTMQIQRADSGNKSSNALTVLSVARVREMLDERQFYLAASTSVLDVGDTDVRFSHQLLQEYFAARYMDTEIKAGRLKAETIWQPDKWWERTNWEEAVILLAGLYSDDCSPVVEWVNAANPEVAALCITRSGAALPDHTRDKLQSTWLKRLTDVRNEPNPLSRAAVGRAFGLPNWDTRKGVNVSLQNGIKLPDVEWMLIPAGKFKYGHESERDSPPQVINLPTFEISRYPITYAQFQTFIDDMEGFYDSRWWEGLAIPEGHNRTPRDQEFKFWNHPRECVSWFDALAFCRWWSWRLGGGYNLNQIETWAVRLPTEMEWEKAARGTDGRLYPYEGEFDVAKSNTWETGIRQTSAVGIYPQGASPYGVMDLSGSVWEWCLTDHNKLVLEIVQEDMSSTSRRVARGGSWYDDQDAARAVYCVKFNSSIRSYDLGFRVSRLSAGERLDSLPQNNNE